MIQKMVQTRLIHSPTEGLISRMIDDTEIIYDPTVDPWGVRFIFHDGDPVEWWFSLERIGMCLAGYGPGPVCDVFMSCVHTYLFFTLAHPDGQSTVSMSKAEVVAALYKAYMGLEDAGKSFDWDRVVAKLTMDA